MPQNPFRSSVTTKRNSFSLYKLFAVFRFTPNEVELSWFSLYKNCSFTNGDVSERPFKKIIIKLSSWGLRLTKFLMVRLRRWLFFRPTKLNNFLVSQDFQLTKCLLNCARLELSYVHSNCNLLGRSVIFCEIIFGSN